MFLTRAELCELTDQPAKRPRKAKLVAALRAMGVPFWLPPSGWPKVARASIEGGQAPASASADWQPRVIHGKKTHREPAPAAKASRPA